jgi:hypothetical protein
MLSFSPCHAWGWLFGDQSWVGKAKRIFLMESLILAQNERWRRGLGMQVERIMSFRIHG